MKITTKHASNSLSRLSHTSILQPLLPAVLLRKLTKVSNKPAFARKNSTLWTVFRKPAFLVLECLKRRKKSFQFSKLSRYVWTDTWSNKFLIYFSSAHDWDRDNMGRATNWRANLSTELTDGRSATGKRHGNLICLCVSLPTPRPFWLEYRRFIFPLRLICHKPTL